ncbi:MAG: hypothetical protein JNJ58_00580, partial [Chitinophagaceae bacterium]|nr:hypothetical protein [Chitinophagaceae bacterium]
MSTSNNNLSQQELYTIAKLCWNSCKQKQSNFLSFKAKYDMPFIDAHLDQIEQAQTL